MNKNLRQLAVVANLISAEYNGFDRTAISVNELKFAHAIIEQCRKLLDDVYNKTALELRGPLMDIDEQIVEYFYRIE